MTLTFGFTSARDILEKAKRDHQRLSKAVSQQSEVDVADALFDFAVTCFHVQDWLKEHPCASYKHGDVDACVATSPALRAFHDLCTAGKHAKISRYKPSTSEVLASTPAHGAWSGRSSDTSVEKKTFVAKIVSTDQSRNEAVAHSAQAIADWESFFRRHGV